MECQHYFYNCSKEYVYSIDDNLYKELVDVISKLLKRRTQAEINNDLFWLLERIKSNAFNLMCRRFCSLDRKEKIGTTHTISKNIKGQTFTNTLQNSIAHSASKI